MIECCCYVLLKTATVSPPQSRMTSGNNTWLKKASTKDPRIC